MRINDIIWKILYKREFSEGLEGFSGFFHQIDNQ